MPAVSSRVRSTAYLVRAAAFGLLALVLFLAGVLPDRKGSAQSIAPVSNAKLDVVVVVDNSDLVSPSALTAVQSALSSYINSLPPEVQVGVVRIGAFPSVAYPLSANRAGAIAAVSALSPDGDPVLFDGLNFAVDSFVAGSTNKRQILLAATGADRSSLLSLNDLTGRLTQRSINLDAIEIPGERATPATLEALAAGSAGRTYALTDRAGLTALAAARVAASTTAPIADPSSRGSSIFNSKLALILGAVLIFGGLAYVLSTMVGAKGTTKIDLLGGVSDVTDRKQSNTAVGGFADKLSNAADKVLEKQGKNRSFGSTLERAGIALRPGEFVIVAIATLLAIFALLYKTKGLMFAGIVTGVLTVFGPGKFVKRKAAKRSAAFGDQLSDTLQLLSSSLRAGQGLMQAVDSVAREGDAPASEEFKRVVVETRLGRDLVDSLRAMADRIRSEDFNWVIPAIEINREVGGDLAEVLDSVAATVRDRADIRRQVKTLSAEGRLSAYVLLSLPVGIAAFINMSSPDYLAELQTSPGWYLAGAAALMMVIGGFWLFKLCNIEF